VDKQTGAMCPDDGNACTSDTCDGLGTCVHPSLPDGTACSNGACQAAVCTPSGVDAGPPLDAGVNDGGSQMDGSRDAAREGAAPDAALPMDAGPADAPQRPFDASQPERDASVHHDAGVVKRDAAPLDGTVEGVDGGSDLSGSGGGCSLCVTGRPDRTDPRGLALAVAALGIHVARRRREHGNPRSPR
jgi:hypothetical protein